MTFYKQFSRSIFGLTFFHKKSPQDLQKTSKMEPKWLQNRSKIEVRFYWNWKRRFSKKCAFPIGKAYFSMFGEKRIQQKSCKFRGRDACTRRRRHLAGFWLDFGSILGAEMGPGAHRKWHLATSFREACFWSGKPGTSNSGRVRPDPPERGRGEVNLSQGKEYQGKEY